MRLKQTLRTMFPNWLNVVVFIPAFLFLVAVLWVAFHAGYQKAHSHPVPRHTTDQSKH